MMGPELIDRYPNAQRLNRCGLNAASNDIACATVVESGDVLLAPSDITPNDFRGTRIFAPPAPLLALHRDFPLLSSSLHLFISEPRTLP